MSVARAESLSTTTWLLKETNRFKSWEKERGRKRGTVLSQCSPHLCCTSKQSYTKYSSNLGTLPAGVTRVVRAVDELMFTVG